MTATQPLHATTLARRGARGWVGVVIMGPSGVGKSDLALRMLAEGWSLVADDWTTLWVSGGQLYASAPPRIQGLLEVRGVGILTLNSSYRTQPLARIQLAVSATHEPIVRLPTAEQWDYQGVSVKHLRLDPRPASASLAIAAAFAAL
jgi:serine kinase of HPr protein (carbohydrate metabolism regulator)